MVGVPKQANSTKRRLMPEAPLRQSDAHTSMEVLLGGISVTSYAHAQKFRVTTHSNSGVHVPSDGFAVSHTCTENSVGRQTVKVFAVSAFTVRCCLRQYGKGTSSSVAFRPFLSDGWKFPRVRLLLVYLFTCIPACCVNVYIYLCAVVYL